MFCYLVVGYELKMLILLRARMSSGMIAERNQVLQKNKCGNMTFFLFIYNLFLHFYICKCDSVFIYGKTGEFVVYVADP